MFVSCYETEANKKRSSGLLSLYVADRGAEYVDGGCGKRVYASVDSAG